MTFWQTVGAVSIGALLSVGTTWLNDIVVTRRRREDERRMACRLVASELRRAGALLESHRNEKPPVPYPPSPGWKWPTSEWDRYHEALARDPEALLVTDTAYEAIFVLNGLLQPEVDLRTFTEDEKTELAVVCEKIDAAVLVLDE